MSLQIFSPHQVKFNRSWAKKIAESQEAERIERLYSLLRGPKTACTLLIEISEKYKLNPHEIIGPRHFAKLRDARVEICEELLARGWSTSQIGKFMNRDHSTIVRRFKRVRPT